MFTFDFNTSTMIKIVIFMVMFYTVQCGYIITVHWIHCTLLDLQNCQD